MVALMATALCAPANATNTLTAVQYQQATSALRAMETTNLIVTGNASLSSDVEGKAYIGGDLSGGGTFGLKRAGKSALASSLARTLTVGGNMSANININNDAKFSNLDIAIGGNSTGTLTINAGSATTSVQVGGTFNAQNLHATNYNGSLQARYGKTAANVDSGDAPYVKKDSTLASGGIHDLKAQIQAETTNLVTNMATLSSVLGALTPNVTLNSADFNNIKFNFDNVGASSYAVLDISSSMLSGTGFSLESFANASNGKTLIINVSGTSVNFSAGQLGDWSNTQQNIIWNFTDATSLTVNKAIYGSVLAPKATVTGSQQLNGSIVAKVFNYQGEVHLGTFNGNSGFLIAPPRGGGGSHGTGAVPEPSSWMTMLAGFGIIGSLIRRQRRRERLAAA